MWRFHLGMLRYWPHISPLLWLPKSRPYSPVQRLSIVPQPDPRPEPGATLCDALVVWRPRAGRHGIAATPPVAGLAGVKRRERAPTPEAPILRPACCPSVHALYQQPPQPVGDSLQVSSNGKFAEGPCACSSRGGCEPLGRIYTGRRIIPVVFSKFSSGASRASGAEWASASLPMRYVGAQSAPPAQPCMVGSSRDAPARGGRDRAIAAMA